MEDINFVFESENAGKRCGCYVESREIREKYPNKLILVPLRTSEYAVEIVNAVANISLTQVYVNPTDSFLEVSYSFPINPDACVYRFAAEFGKTRVEGIVKEKEEAQREYKEAVSQGKRAAIGALDEFSKDILHLKVGNISPREEVRIELVFMQELTLANNTFYQLRLLGTISPRYLNHVPKQSLLEGFRNPTAKATGAFYWNFSISLRSSRKVVFFDSYSHDVILVSQNEQQTALELAMERAAVPNKDFVFTYTTENFELPSYVFGRTDCSSSAMLSFIPKFCALGLDDAYKASVAGKAVETEVEQAKGEYVFLLDRSGSMGGKRIQKAKEALILFIKSLPEDTFFNVVSFGDGSKSLFPQSVRYADTAVEKAVNAVKTMGADMGGTEVYAPLSNLLASPTIAGYPKQIFLLTDGGVSNTEGVIKMVAAKTKFARVHTIGIGNGASEALIIGCAKSGKGHHVFISDLDNPSEKIIQLLTDSLSPVISAMKLGYDNAVVASIVPNPNALPYVLKDEVVNFYITFRGQLAQPTPLTFSYEDSANKLPFAAEIVVDPAAMNQSFVDRMGHFRRIRLLEEALSNNTEVAELMYAAKVVDLKAEIIKESVRHQILSKFTAFLCVEKELVDGRYEEIKGKGQISVQVENPLPKQYLTQQRASLSSMGSRATSNNRVVNFPKPASSSIPQMQDLCRSIPPPQASYRLSACVQQQSLQKKSQNYGSSARNSSQPQSRGFVDVLKGFFGISKQSQKATKQKQQYKEALSSPIKRQKMVQMQDDQQCQDVCQNEVEKQCQEVYKKKDKFQTICSTSKRGSKYDDVKKKQREPDALNLQKMSCALGQLMECNIQNSQLTTMPIVSIKKQYKIEDIISLQSSDGSWKELSLIGHLFGKLVEERVAKEPKLIVVITLLMVKWIQKNHPSKQYSLLTKKGISFIKKEADFEALSAAYADIIQ